MRAFLTGIHGITWSIWLGLVVASCTSIAPLPTQPPSASPTSTFATPLVTFPSVAPSGTALASTAELPDPGGTCSAGQLVQGRPTTFPGYGSAGYMLQFVAQPVRNTGEGCTLQLPGTLAVATATGAFQPVTVSITRRPTAVDFEAQQVLLLVLGDHRRVGVYTDTGATALPAPPCGGAISDVARIAFPLAEGSIEIDLDTIWREVCSSPPSMTVTVDTCPPRPSDICDR